MESARTINPKYKKLKADKLGKRTLSTWIDGEVITVFNPYNHTTWEELVITPEMNIHPNASIIIIDGKQYIISKAWAGSLRTQGSLVVSDPNLII